MNFKMEEETSENIPIQTVRESQVTQATSKALLHHASAPLHYLHNSKTWKVQKTPHVLLSSQADLFHTKHLPSA